MSRFIEVLNEHHGEEQANDPWLPRFQDEPRVPWFSVHAVNHESIQYRALEKALSETSSPAT